MNARFIALMALIAAGCSTADSNPEVSDSVAAGNDLDATQAADFQGYALWDWVHTWVNVPATHAELSE